MSNIKSIGNINNVPNFSCEKVIINNATIENLTTSTITHPTMVTSTSTITNNSIIRGDVSSRCAQSSSVIIDDSNNISGVTSLNTTSLKTNTITSIRTNDDIILDANSTGQMKFNTITNNECLFEGDTAGLSFNWAIKTTFSDALSTDHCPIMGIVSVGGQRIACIGSNDLQAANWTPLYIQPVFASGSYSIFGDEPYSVVNATGAKVYIKGALYSTGHYTSKSNLLLQKTSTTSSTITSTPTANKTHTIPDVDANFVMTEGAQTVNSVKTFNSNVTTEEDIVFKKASSTSATMIGTFTANRTITLLDKNQTLIGSSKNPIGLYTSDLTGLSVN
jgi:hypothetical protein